MRWIGLLYLHIQNTVFIEHLRRVLKLMKSKKLKISITLIFYSSKITVQMISQIPRNSRIKNVHFKQKHNFKISNIEKSQPVNLYFSSLERINEHPYLWSFLTSTAFTRITLLHSSHALDSLNSVHLFIDSFNKYCLNIVRHGDKILNKTK